VPRTRQRPPQDHIVLPQDQYGRRLYAAPGNSQLSASIPRVALCRRFGRSGGGDQRADRGPSAAICREMPRQPLARQPRQPYRRSRIPLTVWDQAARTHRRRLPRDPFALAAPRRCVDQPYAELALASLGLGSRTHSRCSTSTNDAASRQGRDTQPGRPVKVPGSLRPDLNTNSVGSGKVIDNSITRTDVADDSVGSDDLGPDSVGSSEVTDESLNANDLGTDSVGSSEIGTAPSSRASSARTRWSRASSR
jgi:hypothetical protein